LFKSAKSSVGGVEGARGVTQKNSGASGRIVVGSVRKERSSANGRVEVAGDVAFK
jgi:hypothetical protein